MIIRIVGRIAAHLDSPLSPDELVSAGRYAEVGSDVSIAGIRPTGALKVDADVLAPGSVLGTKTLAREIDLLGRRFATAEELLIITARHRDLFGYANLTSAPGIPGSFSSSGALQVGWRGEGRVLRVLWNNDLWTPDHRILTVMK